MLASVFTVMPVSYTHLDVYKRQGGTDYSNYVSWHEGYFEFVEMESIEA